MPARDTDPMSGNRGTLGAALDFARGRNHDCHAVRTAPTSNAQLGLRMGVAATVGLFAGIASFFFVQQRGEAAAMDYKKVIGDALGAGFLIGIGAGLVTHLVMLGSMWAAQTSPTPMVTLPTTAPVGRVGGSKLRSDLARVCQPWADLSKT